MTTSGSVERSRSRSTLASGFPGTIAGLPSRGAVAPLSVSRRRSAWRLAASGPWQAKQVSARIGRMSRSNRTPDGAGASAACAPGPATAPTETTSTIDASFRARRIVVCLIMAMPRRSSQETTPNRPKPRLSLRLRARCNTSTGLRGGPAAGSGAWRGF
jgi:hypothetical protein